MAASAVTSADCNQAIQRVLNGGQSVRLQDGSEYRQANLDELIALRDRLIAEENAAAGQPMFRQVTFRSMR